jgi:hypothetical protein
MALVSSSPFLFSQSRKKTYLQVFIRALWLSALCVDASLTKTKIYVVDAGSQFPASTVARQENKTAALYLRTREKLL